MKRIISTALPLIVALAVSAQQPSLAPVSPDRPIAPNDMLSISIVGERDLLTEFRVSGSGAIQFPFLGSVEVAGLNPAELGTRLQTRLAEDYFVDPQVIVTVREYRQDLIYVFGEVNRPGPINLPSDRKIDILEAIAFANGTTRMAKNKLQHTRKGVTRTHSLDDLKRITDPTRRIMVEPGDIIEVKESAF